MPSHSTLIDPYYFTDEWVALRTIVVSTAKEVCAYCGCQGFQADHIIPRKKGGPDNLTNLACCCPRCNRLFGNQVFPTFEAKKSWLLAELKRLVEKERRKIHPPEPCRYKRISKIRGCTNPSIPGSVYCKQHHQIVIEKKLPPKAGGHKCDYRSKCGDPCLAKSTVQIGKFHFCDAHKKSGRR